jgi:DGQHR domain-containing protein
MKEISSFFIVPGLVGKCGGKEVFLGFAPAKVLHELSFADVLNEDTGEGYQRPRNKNHSLDFNKYIKTNGSSTIPLTFNLRKDLQNAWKIEKHQNGTAVLYLEKNTRCLAQVDCQHRLGELYDVNIPLAFMSFIGLDLRAEMAQFVIINSKARGLSSSLTDYHDSNLLANLAEEAPHLYIAKKLNEDFESPWFKLIRYGGETTSGLKRRTSFRMMQKAISRFLSQTRGTNLGKIEEIYAIVRNYWKAVQIVFPHEWSDHRHHLITKGIGLHSLTRLLADIVTTDKSRNNSVDLFKNRLSALKGKIDWSSRGKFAHAGGQKGVQQVHGFLREVMGFESVTGRTRL